MADRAVLRRAGKLRSFIFVTGSTVIGGLLNALLIALASRRGEFDEIAAFTVVTAVMAVVGVAVGGGAAFLYITGSEEDRRGVRSQKILAVQPVLLLSVLAVSLFYSGRGYALGALLAAGLVFVNNNFAEFPLAQLNRDRRFVQCAVPTYLSKGGALAAFVLGLPLTDALLVGAVINLVTLEILAGPDGTLRSAWHDRPTFAAARRGFVTTRRLLLYTLLELYALRAPSIALSLIVPVAMMGNFGAVSSVYQAILAVFSSGLLMVLSLRSQRNHELDPGESHDRITELLSLLVGLFSAALLVLAAPFLTTNVLHLSEPEAATWLRILGFALLFNLLNRIVIANAMGDGRNAYCARIAGILAVLTTLVLIVAVPRLGVTGGVLAIVVAEGVVATTLVGRRLPSLIRRRVAK
jgi:O-antigen/teichoic acid export membrane protein